MLHASVKNLSLSIYSPLKYRGAHLESGSSETRIRGEGVERGKLEGENPSPSCEKREQNRIQGPDFLEVMFDVAEISR